MIERDPNELSWFNGISIERIFCSLAQQHTRAAFIFFGNPRQAMEQIVGVPSDIPIRIDHFDDEIWFQASVPKFPEEGQGNSLLGMRKSNERMNRCPVLRVSGREFIDNHIEILAEYGIRVPEDVVVIVDSDPNGYLHFRVRLDLLYSF